MSSTAASRAEELSQNRREQILNAAEQCFSRTGFHRTTMQEIAVEAGMSPGNLYRYFDSKDAMVAGLSERDRMRLRDEFVHLAGAQDFMKAFAAIGRKHFQEDPREKAALCLEIWSEATRNPTFAQMQQACDHEITTNMLSAFRHAQAQGVIPPTVDIEAVTRVIHVLGDGLMVHRATMPDFNPERDVSEVIRLIGAMLTGAVSFEKTKSDVGAKP
jgi:TetR/AcrR family transcriptional regulator, repressor for uid operon